MVASHYGRFLRQDQDALAARILNQLWMEFIGNIYVKKNHRSQ